MVARPPRCEKAMKPPTPRTRTNTMTRMTISMDAHPSELARARRRWVTHATLRPSPQPAEQVDRAPAQSSSSWSAHRLNARRPRP